MTGLEVAYGDVKAVSGVSLHVDKGELVGGNGSGKSTILRVESGMLRARGGSATCREHNLNSVQPHKITNLSMVHVSVSRQLFGQMSVEGHLLMDEPSLGLAPRVVREVMRATGSLRELGLTALLVKQDVRQVLRVTDRACVLKLSQPVK